MEAKKNATPGEQHGVGQVVSLPAPLEGGPLRIRVFGLTGGLASGKSSVAAHWRARGLPVIDSDVLARQVVTQGSAALADIVRAFGSSVLREGALDRQRLASLVFSDPESLRRLEAITHPRIEAERVRLLGGLEAAGEPLACSEVPLLFEKGLDAYLRPVVVVSLPVLLQVSRAMARDQSSEESVRARLTAQLPLAEKVARADYVIDNSGSLAVTLAASDGVLQSICDDLGVDSRRY